MSGLIDTNLLVYAINKDSPLHKKAFSFLEDELRKSGPVYLCWPIIYEFLRITTHPKVFDHPLTWKEAWRFIADLLENADIILLVESDEHKEVLENLLKSLRHPHGNFLHDCHIAALLKENGVKIIYTHDTDFRQFGFLEVIDPI